MICPQCNLSFDTISDGELPAYNCPTCSGTWIAGRSLHSFLAGSKNAANIEATLDSIFDLEFRESGRKCPSCSGRHLKIVIVEKTELDFCASCKGLFFDPGELNRVFPDILDQGQGQRENGARGFWHNLLSFTKEAN